MRRAKAPAKKTFDRQEIAVRAKDYDKKSDNFLDYSDMNMRIFAFQVSYNEKVVALLFHLQSMCWQKPLQKVQRMINLLSKNTEYSVMVLRCLQIMKM